MKTLKVTYLGKEFHIMSFSYKSLVCLATDKSGITYAFSRKPIKHLEYWKGNTISVWFPTKHLNISNVSWEDSLRFYRVVDDKIEEITEEQYDLLKAMEELDGKI